MKNPQPFWRSPDVQRLGLCSTEKLMFHNTLMFHPYVPGGLMFHRLMFQAGAYVPPTGLMFHRTTGRIVPDACRCPTWSVGVRSPSCFSRDTQNPQPFWRSPDVQAASLCLTSLMSHGAYVSQNLMSHGAYVSRTLCLTGGLCLTGRAYVSPKRPPNRPRCLQVSHLKCPRPITFFFVGTPGYF